MNYKNIISRFNLKPTLYVLPILSIFFIFYLVWLQRAYEDVAYMDTIQILAGNINHMYNNDFSLHEFYYRSPFLLFFSTVLTFINCKLFSYNSFYENVISGVSLFLIALYFIKTNIKYFSNRNKLVFIFLASLIIFCLIKWEMSLWGGGFSHFIVVLLGFVCIDLAHKYYFGEHDGKFINKYFLPIYIIMSVIAILETTSYFLPFQISLIILLLVNYKIFRDKIDLRKWRMVFGTTILLMIFAVGINYLAESYAIKHPYEVYGKVNVSQSMGSSFVKIIKEPAFVIKFFLVANAGTLIDKDTYKDGSFAKEIMPFLGLLLLLLYSFAFYLFIKYRKKEGTIAANLILYTVILYGTILIARMGFNDVYYGGSSRYTAASFSGILGLATIFLLFWDQRNNLNAKKYLYLFPLVIIAGCSLMVYYNQWKIAPYRKESFKKMAENLKSNTNLENLMAYNTEIAQKAREMMVRNKLNVFKPETKAENFTLNSNLVANRPMGFYDIEKSENNSFRWTNGEGIIYLPNLYTTSDSIKVLLKAYAPMPDTPIVILNDRFLPSETKKLDDGYEFTYVFQEQKVFFKAVIKNKSFKPQEIDKNSTDQRTLGLIFHSLTFNTK
jgi:hypothetical protein